ncbi:MAG: glutamine-hydrolyzing carbamoyl-phosphate synthase small subunit [bacterium]|nr:glutamine-hydrolyzing carbamoyl-phosphate synthase small subunit [bacterium]
MPYCALAIEDGTVFVGHAIGAAGTATGEVVFNTAMTGYQEVLTDPSYCGQIVTMTYPLIGNYGVNSEDAESSHRHVSGFVVKELARRPSNHRSDGDLATLLRESGVVALAGVDTRALTRRLRMRGALRGAISTQVRDPGELVTLAREAPSMTGRNLVCEVAAPGERVCESTGPGARRNVVALDCGIKHNILRLLDASGCAVTLVPHDTPAERILEHRPHGLLVGNGPGDPAAVSGTVSTLKLLLGRVPILGICLGHQLLALALGARTYKLKFGHHGANHPVLDLDTGRVEITSQNHGFAVDRASLEAAGARLTHVSLYDQSVEGFAHDELNILAVQYHPEAAPGPHDSRYIFRQFVEALPELSANRSGVQPDDRQSAAF